MAKAIVNGKFSKDAKDKLSRMGFEVTPLPESRSLAYPMSTHPDMLIFIDFDSLVCHKNYYEGNRDIIYSIVNGSGLSLALSEEKIDKNYPHDAIFNAAVVGNSLICNTKYVSRHILDIAKTQNANIIHTNQGYTKCSTLIVGENDIVTSDRGIHAAAQASGINSLLIGSGNVSLEPYEYGFIGGASGMYENKVYFCGNLDSHPDKEKICEFIAACGKECVFLPFDELTDMGSIIFTN